MSVMQRVVYIESAKVAADTGESSSGTALWVVLLSDTAFL